jgi:adenylate cyclase
MLSERLGAERTKSLLNPYLGTMSGLLVEHRAIVNKFMGDGIFAFFNAPIWPCAGHADAACACAVASLEALCELNRRRPGDGDPLVMRIGISTGEAFVGDYGSDTKLDYTCIGDTVNLGARLEAANKTFGTSVLVDGTTRQHASVRFAFRWLGRIAVAGRMEAAEAYELVGVASDIDAEAHAYAAQFEQAVRHYQACEWDGCLACLRLCRDLRPDDGTLAQYWEAASRYARTPPPPDWNRAIGPPVT